MKQTREKVKMRKGAAFGIIAVMVGTMLLASIPTVSASEELYGDANGDGKIDMRDVTYVGLIILGKKPANELADANQDGRRNVLDITYIELIILGKVQKYPLRAGTTSRLEPISVQASNSYWHFINDVGAVTHIGLCVYNPDLTLAPGLAESWEISPDGKSITFYLVKNAKWHDGTPVTAEDVKFSLEYSLYHKLLSKLLDDMDYVDVVDKHTVTIYLNVPSAGGFVQHLPICTIKPKHVWEDIDNPKEYFGDDSMIGCGPFIFEKYDRDADVALLKANTMYFGGKPSIDRIEIHYYRTVDSMLLALKQGDIDMLLDYYKPVSGVYAANLIDAKGVELAIVPDTGVQLDMVFGYRQYPTNVTEFREAVSYAIDYQAIVDMIAAGYGEVPRKGFIPPPSFGYNPDHPKLYYDATKANEILDSLNFIDSDGDGIRNLPDGSELIFPLIPEMMHPETIRAAEVISYQLEKVGIDAEVEVLDRAKTIEKIFGTRDYYIYVGYTTPLATENGAALYFADMPGWFLGTCKDPEYLALAEDAKYAKNPDEYKEAVYKLQEYNARELPGIAVIWGKAIYPYRSDRFEGWVKMNGYGVANYWSWFSIKPVAS